MRDPAFDALAAQGGTYVDMPFWRDLSGAREILSDSGSLTPAKLATSGNIARIHDDGRAWAWNILAKYASGAAPAAALATYIADYWSWMRVWANVKRVLMALRVLLWERALSSMLCGVAALGC